MTETLAEKTIVIAGGSSGIGLALAKRAVAEGAQVHLLGRSAEKLGRARADIGGEVFIHRLDIGVESDIESLARILPRIDHLVTTAADLTFKPFLQMGNEEILRMLGSKFWGPVYLVRHLVPWMTKEGSITFYSGSAAYKAWSGASIVATLNAGLDGLARTLAVELAPIRVNVISPGVVDSPTWDGFPVETRAQVLSSIGEQLLVGRVGTVEELADAGLFLMANRFATGTVLQLDGGDNA